MEVIQRYYNGDKKFKKRKIEKKKEEQQNQKKPEKKLAEKLPQKECQELIFDLFKEDEDKFPSYYQIKSFIDVLKGIF